MLHNIRIIPPNLNEKFRYVHFIAYFEDVQFSIFFDFLGCWGGYVKGLVFVPPLPANLEELRQRITTAL